MLGVAVRRERAEGLRSELASLGLVDKARAIMDEDRMVIVPLLARPAQQVLERHGATVVEREFRARTPRTDPIDEIRRLAEVPEEFKGILPGKWELYGQVLVIRLDPVLDRYEQEIARAYAEILGAKTVLKDTGGVVGEYRRPVTKKLLGTDTVAAHRENGIAYGFDASEIMFSSGNMDERIRMAGISCDRETVVDMFAGIGYFALPLAVHQRPAKIVACEINPVAHSYLVQNVAKNRVGDVVEPVLGDNRDLPGRDFADRVIMGYLRTTHEFLPTALRLLRSAGVVHYHETCPNELLPDRPIQRLLESCKGGKVVIERFKEVKSFAPGVTHVVVDARVFKPS